MQISTKEMIGFVLALLGVLCGGVAMSFPEQRWIGLVMIGIAITGMIWLIFHHFEVERKKMLPVLGMIIFGRGFAGCATWYFWPISLSLSNQATAQIEPAKIEKTLTAKDRPLQNLSNAQLRVSTIELAAKMRTFEANSSSGYVDYESGILRSDTEEQKNTKWNAMIKRSEFQHNQLVAAFSNTFLGQARDLRDEIIFRLKSIGVFAPYVEIDPFESIGPSILDGGLLAGPQPITTAANYLEKLARRLP